ncbi:MAG: choice-of-anchor L domain-containing protein [Chitinophagales bacterium]
MNATQVFSSFKTGITVFLCIIIHPVFAQLEVDDSPTADELATSLVGSGVTISGVELDCADGAFGFFTCVDCNVGIADGVLLTSGAIDQAVGPNNSSGAGDCPGTPGDDDLEDYIDDITNDACILEFDVTVTSDTLKFDYVFGSDEYLEYVFSFNDGFAFFISGPGITGTENLALIPGTSDPVSIDNVNDIVNPEYYVDNGDGFTSPYSTDEFYIQYDGFTTVLTAKRDVIPCETYHLKLVVADALDCVLDSGVFIKGGSLSSPGVEITYETDLGGYPDLIEECNDGNLIIDLSFAPVDTFEVIINVGGTAISGVDYVAIPTVIEFLPGTVTTNIPINVITNPEAEGLETIIITVESGGCITGIGDSLVVNIHDYLPMQIEPLDTTICPGASVTISADGANTYSWSPGETLNTTSGDVVIATPTENTTYSVTGTFFSCVNTVYSTINLSPPLGNAGNDTTIIITESAILNGSGGTTYSWTPTSTLNDPNVQNPIASPTVTTTYTVTVTDENGCISSDEVTVFVSNTPIIVFPNAFTPNGDGINDLYNLINRGVLATFTLQIYNRWGEIIYEANPGTPGWDGTYNGKEQPMGSYAYMFNASDFDGNTYTAQGNFTLVR